MIKMRKKRTTKEVKKVMNMVKMMKMMVMMVMMVLVLMASQRKLIDIFACGLHEGMDDDNLLPNDIFFCKVCTTSSPRLPSC